MRIQINLGVSKYRRKFFDAIGGAALREFIGKILRVVVGKLHNINEFLADHFYVVPSCYCWAECCGPWRIYPASAGKGNPNGLEQMKILSFRFFLYFFFLDTCTWAH